MVRIGVVGLGHCGSTLAFALLQVPQVTVIGVIDSDLKKQAGELEDLEQAMMMFGIENKTIIPNISDSEILFICAGHPRRVIGNHFETDGSLYDRNYMIVDTIIDEVVMEKISKEKIYIVTNPSGMIANKLGCNAVGIRLDHMRNNSGCMSGLWILQRKGFTNFGVVAECVEIVKNFINNHTQVNG